MARRRTTVGIISLSAIDLFASTLGAFVIITAILIPYYPNMKDGAATTERLKAEIAVEREEAAALADEHEKLTAEERSKRGELARWGGCISSPVRSKWRLAKCRPLLRSIPTTSGVIMASA